MRLFGGATARRIITYITVGALLGAGLTVGASLTVTSSAQAAEPAPQLLDPADYTGMSADKAAASCWEIKQLHPDFTSGAYWVLTPKMTSPLRVYCDQETDGGGWVKVGQGRETWEAKYIGKGTPAALLSPATPAGGTNELDSSVVDGLLDGRSVSGLDDGVRLRRAAAADGSAWQEVRFQLARATGWKWTWASESPVTNYSFDGQTGTGGSTVSFGMDDASRRVYSELDSNQGWTWGFAYGSGVTGTNSATTYLWSATDGRGNARPVTEVYIRPKVSNVDAGFTRIADSGTAKWEGSPQPSSFASRTPWGVSGLAGSISGFDDVEVRAFAQIGNTMYVGGNFAYVQRDSAGTGRVNQSFLAAFDATTGEFIPSFTPTFNEAVESLAVLPNGNLFVGGSFTAANGATANGAVSVNPTTGATTAGWSLKLENGIGDGIVRVQAATTKGNYTYLVGLFTHATGTTGGRVYSRGLVRVDSNGQPDHSWLAEAKGSVRAVAVSEDGATAYIAGNFGGYRTTATSSATAISTAAGANLANPGWLPEWSNGPSYQQAVAQVNGRIWVGGSEHMNFSYDVNTYDRLSTNITKNRGGDFQGYGTNGSLLFAGCHCAQFNYSGAKKWPNIGSDWSSVDAINWIGAWNTSTGDFVSSWNPHMSTRSGSGVWAIAVSASDGSVWAGGDISGGRVSGGSSWFGGFARFAPADTTAPGTPTNFRVSSQNATNATLAWAAPSGGLGSGTTGTYQVLLDDRVIAETRSTSVSVPLSGERRYFVRAVDAAGNIGASSPVLGIAGGIVRPTASFTSTTSELTVAFDASGSSSPVGIAQYIWSFGDGSTETTTVPTISHAYFGGGDYTVGLIVRDVNGRFTRVTSELALAQPVPGDTYGATVFGDQPWAYWRMNEASGTMAADSATGAHVATYQQGVTLGAGGLVEGNTAAQFDGVDDVLVSKDLVNNPTTFSTEAWFKTTTTRGGKIIGFGRAPSGLSGSYDRHVYMQDDGRLVFGVYVNATYTITSPSALNDGQWHHVVATLSGDGMAMYVDGQSVGTNPQTSAENYSGYWRVGGDNTWGSSSAYFNGTIDEAAVYNTALTPEQVKSHYAIGLDLDEPVTSDPYAQAVLADQPNAYWRLDSDKRGMLQDASGHGFGGVVVDTPTQTTDSGVSGGHGSLGFDGQADGAAANAIVQGPDSYASEVWFRTSTTRGGKLMGFGDRKSGYSSNYDRHVYMLDDGRIVAGVWTGQATTVTTPLSYNDGQWHQVVAQLGGSTLSLYVDGTHIGDAQLPAQVQQYSGYWRLGGDSSWGGTSAYFAGDLDEFSLYSAPLTPQQVLHQYQVGTAQNQAPVAQFSVTTDYLGVAVDASASTDPDGTIASASWDFGDSTDPVDGITATHVYSAAGTYTVTLTVTDDGGASSTVTQDVTVQEVPNVPPVAVIGASMSDLTLSATSAGSTDQDGTIVSSSWDFGDGQTSTEGAPTHAYASAGQYTVTLTVTDDRGAQSTATQQVTAVAPNLPPTAVIGSQADGLTVTFDGSQSADSDGSIVSYHWDFGDSASSAEQSPVHAYSASGTYSVTLVVTDNRGATASASASVAVVKPNDPPTAVIASVATGLSVTFDGSGSSDPDGSIASYAWDFGDHSTSTEAAPVHVFAAAGTYTVTLIVTDDHGATGSTTTDVTVVAANIGPTAVIGSTVTGLSVAFVGTGSTDSDGSVASYHWDFGDGQTSVDASPTHVYASGGAKTVVLTVTDDDGATGTATAQLTLVAPNTPPTAVIGSTISGLSVAFVGTGSTDAEGSVVSYLWSFGDGQTSTEASPTHVYASPAEYTVTLTVTDDAGATGSATANVAPTAAPNVPPTAVIGSTVSGMSVAFVGTGSSDSDGSVVGYAWDFGDGQTSTEASPTHVYSSAGDKTVTLTVTDDRGASASATTHVVVGVPTTAEVISAGSQWKYYYGAAAPAAGWKGLSFDDGSWAVGAAPLGYGSTLVTTNLNPVAATADRPRAAYFRSAFTVADASKVTALDLSSVADDGVVIYVNGVEVKRQNMFATEVTHQSFASTAPRTSAANASPVTVSVPRSLLVNGTNVITAEVHVNYRGTPDISFKLTATTTTQP